MNSRYTSNHLQAIKIIFSLYLCVHFAYLIPYAGELFSADGLFPSQLSPTYGYFPNIFNIIDTAWFATVFVGGLFLLSVFMLMGLEKKWLFLLLWLGWATLLNRNPLIRNPGMPYVGWMLLALAVIYPLKDRVTFRLNSWIYAGAWSLLAVGYTVSGIDKLNSPSWIDGSAISHLLSNPLSRDYFLTHWLAELKWLHPIMTYFSLTLEVLFLPLALFKRTRPWIWLGLVGMQLGILFVVDFADLTFGMLMIHLMTFDPRWISNRVQQPLIVFFDGVCNLCNHSVDFLINEDVSGKIQYSPLQGEEIKKHNIQIDQQAMDTFFLFDGTNMYIKSQAWKVLFLKLGGLWYLLALPLKFIPAPIADKVYDLVARNRYKIFGQRETCRLPTPEERALFLD